MTLFWLAIAVLLTAPCYAQSAKVLAVEPSDAERANVLYERMKQAERDWEDFQQATKEKYLTVPYDSPERGNIWYESPPPEGGATTGGLLYWSGSGTVSGCSIISDNPPSKDYCNKQEKERAAAWEKEKKTKRWKRAGWEDFEFEWSKDFKFIVPKTPSVTISGVPCSPFYLKPADAQFVPVR